MIGRKMLEFQLRRLGVFDAAETISAHPNFDDNYKIREFYFPSSTYNLNICSLILFKKIIYPVIPSLCVFPVWANHGDDISIQYSGTPALKGDFVRYI